MLGKNRNKITDGKQIREKKQERKETLSLISESSRKYSQLTQYGGLIRCETNLAKIIKLNSNKNDRREIPYSLKKKAGAK